MKSKRRDFLKSALLTGSGLACSPRDLFSMQASSIASPQDQQIKRVLVMFKCHFDAGFINTQKAVVARYFTEYFPQAIRVAEQMEQSGSDRYVWTTGSWLLYEYLEQANAEDRRQMEQAIAAGNIAWHAIPFNWQTEMMDRSMIGSSIALSHSLDRRFGQTTTGAKMTDVPGHTRGLIRPIADQGVTFLDIGVNDASTPAEVPPIFLWKDSGGASLVVMYHHGYGGISVVPGSDLAIAIVVRGDNSGPHKPEEIVRTYSDLRSRFPNAKVTATNLTEIANAAQPFRTNLPVVTQEIGDSWIYGVASDPLKVARYREVSRLRLRWIADGKFHAGDATDVALLRSLLLEAEHTWGTDTKTWLDFDHYIPRDLDEMLQTKNYEVVEFSWKEKRQDLFDAVATLPAPLRDESLASIRALEAAEPRITGRVARSEREVETEHFVIGLDAATGAIRRLQSKRSGHEWAAADKTLAAFSYQTLSQADYAGYFSNYVISSADWAKKDFGKPNIERFGAKSQEWTPNLLELRSEEDAQGHRLLASLVIRDSEAVQSGRASFPQRMYMEILLPKAEPIVRINFSWFQKPATRMPEALWLSFNPVVSPGQQWSLDKSGERVSPFDVVPGGSRHMHAVSSGFELTGDGQSLGIETVDAPLIALGQKSPLNFSKSQPDLAGGIHCSLFNNAWGTNYIMWFGENMNLRFVLRPS